VGNIWRDPKRGLGGSWVTQAKPESGTGLAFAVSDDLRSWKLAEVEAALPECAGCHGGIDTQSIVIFDERRDEYALFTRRKVPPPQLPRAARTVYRSVRRLTAKTVAGNGSQWSYEQTVAMDVDEVDNATHMPALCNCPGPPGVLKWPQCSP
jgi:hypothetical protein